MALKTVWLRRFRVYEFFVLAAVLMYFSYKHIRVSGDVCIGRLGSAEAILDCLDRGRDYVPMVDNQNHDTFAMRLHGFRSDSTWAIVFEQAVWWPSASGVHTIRSCFGKCTPEAYGPANPRGELFDIAPVVNDYYGAFLKTGEWPSKIDLRGVSIPTVPKRELRFSSIPGNEANEFFLLMLDLAKTNEASFFSSGSELRALVGDLPELVTASLWHHPDLAGGELPSSTSSLRRLANILEGGAINATISKENHNLDYEMWLRKKNGAHP